MIDIYQKLGVPYAIPTPEAYYVHVFSPLHIQELAHAPEDHLSLHALSRDVSFPMSGDENDGYLGY